ncbi:disease resistance protein Pik-2-like [Lolium perenne]|uniref:disease resistance protein Pik-2-like n=1 Tax=Lolium perenne TaxID=4522 RepID=UPI0021F6405C|nr:disease resistance protein Pik-2-like [Lolium perenne]
MLMEATALSIGKSVLNGALSYAKSALAEEVALQLGVRRDQLFITNELEMMQAFLMVAHDEGVDSMVVKVWVKQVRDVAYDVEDSLQEFAVRLQKQSWWRIHQTLLDRRRVAKQMKELRANVEDVSQRNMRYHLIKGSSSKPATIGGQSAVAEGTTMSGTAEVMRLREKAKVDLVRLINRKDNDLIVIAVSGTSAGHLGKMSIIKDAYEDPMIQKKFECRAWIGKLMCPFNLTEFLQSIIEQFHVNFLQESGEKEKEKEKALDLQVLRKMRRMKENRLVREFKRYVNEKSYLIILNEIHTIEEWGQIKPCFLINKHGSRIVVCAEQVGVASLCVGPEDTAPEYKQLLAYHNLYAFYEKGSRDGTNLTEAGPSSNVGTAVSDNSANRKMLNRTGTILEVLKESQLIGRETEKEEIIKQVTTEDSQLQVISVWGMGGLGKTTLVRDVYQDEKLSGKFPKRACATIMRPFNVNELLQNLASQFGYNNVPEMDKELLGKKYLIVLDDLSSNAEWDTIIPHFPLTQTSSRIIVTTRVKDIATHCSKNHEKIYTLRSLEDDKALDLFTKKIFGKATNMDEEYPELVEHANLILKKCNGLPLAIVTIGGFLANQPKTVMEWRKLNEHISAELVMNPEIGIIRTILMRSYDGLPYYLKSCFLYMPIFPEDYMVGRKRLVRRWSAEGYSREVHGKSAEEILDGYFMELISRSMLLPSQQSIHGIEGIGSCQIHDLIREIGISKSMEENLVLTVEEGCSSNSQGTMRHLAINGNWKGDRSDFESIVDMSRVRSVTVFGEWKSFFISDKMSLLRVLDLEDTTGLRDHHLKHIGKFLHLRYLSLRGCDAIYHLPDSLGNLRELVALDVRGTRIIKLPRSIVNLQKLSYLCSGRKPDDEDGSYEDNFDGIPKFLDNRPCIMFLVTGIACCWRRAAAEILYDGIDLNCHDACTALSCYYGPFIAMRLDLHGVLVQSGMRKLKALHTLSVVNIARGGKDVLKDIKGLTQLRKLGVTGVNKENGQGLCSAIEGLSRLESLSIRSEGEPGLSGCLDGTFSFPEKLQSLKLYGNLVKLPEWIQGLRNLVKLKLRSSKISEHDDAIQVLGDLPNLASLHLLTKSFEQTNACLTFRPHMFLNLVVLELHSLLIHSEYLNKALFVKFEQGATPKLELLEFRSAWINSRTVSGLPSLASLKEVLLEGGYYDDDLAYLRAELAKNPNLPVIKMV